MGMTKKKKGSSESVTLYTLDLLDESISGLLAFLWAIY